MDAAKQGAIVLSQHRWRAQVIIKASGFGELLWNLRLPPYRTPSRLLTCFRRLKKIKAPLPPPLTISLLHLQPTGHLSSLLIYAFDSSFLPSSDLARLTKLLSTIPRSAVIEWSLPLKSPRNRMSPLSLILNKATLQYPLPEERLVTPLVFTTETP